MKILIADDDQGMCDLIIATLQGAETCNIFIAKDGDEALSIARKENPDLIILDINMPKKDGLQVCRELKIDPTTSWMRIILLTALDGKAERTLGMGLGANAYITKPFSPTALLVEIDKA